MLIGYYSKRFDGRQRGGLWNKVYLDSADNLPARGASLHNESRAFCPLRRMHKIKLAARDHDFAGILPLGHSIDWL